MSAPVDVLAAIDTAMKFGLQHSGRRQDLSDARAAVAELIEVNRRTALHLEQAVAFIDGNYPNARHLDAGPILRNMKRWSANLRAALANCRGAK